MNKAAHNKQNTKELLWLFAFSVLNGSFSVPLSARPVGEWDPQREMTDSFEGLGNIEQIQSALFRGVGSVSHLERALAALPSTPQVGETAQRSRAEEWIASENQDAFDSSGFEPKTGEQRSQGLDAPAGTGASNEDVAGRAATAVERLEEAAEGLKSYDRRDSFGEIAAGASASAERGPAVLPRFSADLRLTQAPPSTFGKTTDSIAGLGAQVDSPGLGEAPAGAATGAGMGPVKTVPTEPVLETPELSEMNEQEQAQLEQALGNLASRQAPYTFKDYQDFRDFISDRQGPLGQLDTSATGFMDKAREVFDSFQNRDVSNETAARKQRYRRFVEEAPTEPMQPLIPQPRQNAKPFSGAGTSH